MVDVDKELLFEFLILDSDEISEVHVKEVMKVIRIVLNKYHSKNFRVFPDLESRIMQYCLERRERFNPKMDAYNYIFTIARNESGNYLNKINHEIPVDEFFERGETEYPEEEVGGILDKYRMILTGCEKNQNVLRISRDDAIELLLAYSNYNTSLIKIKRVFSQREAKQLYVLCKLLLSQ